LIVTVHDLQPLMMPEWTAGRPWPLPAIYRRFYQWMYPLAFRRAERLLTVSHTTARQLIARFPRWEDKTLAIPRGFDPEPPPADPGPVWERLRARFDLPDRYLLFIGSTRPNKNLPRMLAAFARFRRQAAGGAGVGFVLILTPDRWMRDVERAIAEEALEPHVRLLPQVDSAEKAVLLQRAAALFFATRLEGFGLPILEAQAARVPVLTSTVDAAPEVAGEGALLIEPSDTVAMAAGLERLMESADLRKQLIENGLRNVNRFAWETTARQTLGVYNETPAL
jgi:alpha-1,3-rhamnosyl/mannosyltransferase